MTQRLQIGLTAILLALSLAGLAQGRRTTVFGLVAGADFSTPVFNDVTLEVEEELRFKSYDGFHLDRWLNELGVDIPLNIPMLGKRLHVGAQVGYVRHYNDKVYYDNRYRVGLNLSYYETFRRFKFSFRTRMLCTFRDERTGEYHVNPKWYWRNKLQAAYQMAGSRFKYTLSSELFYRIRQEARYSFVDQVRTTLTVNYRLTRRQYLGVFVRMDNDLQVSDPMDIFYIGLNYDFKN